MKLIFSVSVLIAIPLLVGGCVKSELSTSASSPSSPPPPTETDAATEPAAAPPPAPTPPASSTEPPLEQMKLARAVGKVSVPVDVHCLASGPSVQGQQVGMQLAFTPRIAGENLTVEFPASDSVSVQSADAALTQQKASATDVIRRSVLVTPRAGGGEVRMIVAMNVEGGRYFGIFSCPLN